MSKRKVTRYNMWLYYDEVKNNVIQAKCKYCEYVVYNYIQLTNVYRHIDTHLDKVKEELKIRMTEIRDKKCFRHDCETCVNLFENRENSYDHVILKHLTEAKEREAKMYFSHYFEIENFLINCKWCSHRFTAYINHSICSHVETRHPDKLNTQETSIIQSENDLWNNYTRLNNFQAKCKRCPFRDHYIYIIDFAAHLRSIHHQIASLEEETIEESLPKYFTFHEMCSLKCFICKQYVSVEDCVTVTDRLECMKNHLNESCASEVDSRDPDNFNCNWMWKYLTEESVEGYQKIRCEIFDCLINIFPYELKLPPFQIHTEGHQNEDYQKAIGSSESQKIRTEKDLWKYYKKLSVFRAKCKQCDVFERHYIKIYGNFYKHLLEKHEEVPRHEEGHKNEKLWRYFYYYSKDKVRCLLCVNFECSPELTYELNEHIQVHLSETIHLDCFDERHWISKYYIESKEKDGKTAGKCNVSNCNDEIKFEFNFKLFSEHTDQHEAGPSGETPSKKPKKGNSSKN